MVVTRRIGRAGINGFLGTIDGVAFIFVFFLVFFFFFGAVGFTGLFL